MANKVMNLKLMGLRCLIKAIHDTFLNLKKNLKGGIVKSVLGRSVSYYCFLIVNTVKMYQFKAKDSEIKPYASFRSNTSKDFTGNNMEKTGLKEVANVSSVDYNVFNKSNVLNIHKDLMKMFEIIKKHFIGLLTSMVNASDHTKCITLSN